MARRLPSTRYAQSAGAKIAYQVSGKGPCDLVLVPVMDAAESQTAVLFGVSDGGRGAIAMAAAHPGRVLGLILYGTSYRGPGPGPGHPP